MSAEDEPARAGRKSSVRQTGPALEAAYRLVLWVVPTVEKYPRNLKFTIGDRTVAAALDVLDALVMATYARERAAHLSAANLALERLRYFFRLAADLRMIDLRRYEHAARLIDETGRLTGGWLKADRAAKT
ncbi:MAG: diversity-generating retroelement protein Avd [Pseudomonadota bacterium]